MSNPDQPALVGNGDVTALTFPDDDYALDFWQVSLSKTGALYAEVIARHGSTVLHVARFDLLNQREQELLHQRCMSTNSSVADWQSRLVSAIPGLRKQATDQTPQSPPPIDLSSAVVSFPEVLRLTLPARKRYLAWLYERGLAMVYGPRGIGKTQFMVALATHLSTGQPFLGWEIPEPDGVLYVDGEMPLDELRQRAVALAEGQAPTSLYFLSSEMVSATLDQD
jgi:hypothetical protein